MADKQNVLPDNYDNWRKEVISLIESSKLKAIFSVNAELLALYWKIGNDILINSSFASSPMPSFSLRINL